MSAVDHTESSRQGEFLSQREPDLWESTNKSSANIGRKWARSFSNTHWSMVLESQTESSTAQEALEKLSQIYWPLIYSLVPGKGVDAEEAKDITQEFSLIW